MADGTIPSSSPEQLQSSELRNRAALALADEREVVIYVGSRANVRGKPTRIETLVVDNEFASQWWGGPSMIQGEWRQTERTIVVETEDGVLRYSLDGVLVS